MMTALAEPMTATASINPATRLGVVHYTVADLDRQISFYQESLGFKLHWRSGNAAGLGGGGADLLHLTAVPGARRVRGTTGLYHTAFFVPTRWELANLLARLAETQTPIEGTNNHYTHLAIYLSDAEGNGIELAWDFPRTKWEQAIQQVRHTPHLARSMQSRLDLAELLSERTRDPRPWTGPDAATTVGHLHLNVADLGATKQFYHTLLGFDLMVDSEEMGAAFFSAGGYHHHIGTNVWHGRGIPTPPAHATGLRSFTVLLPDTTDLERLVAQASAQGITAQPSADGLLLRDPAGNGVLLTTA